MRTGRNAKNASTRKLSNNSRRTGAGRERSIHTTLEPGQQELEQGLGAEGPGMRPPRQRQKLPLQAETTVPSSGHGQPRHRLTSHGKVRSETGRESLQPRHTSLRSKKSVLASTGSILWIYVTILTHLFRLKAFSNTDQPKNVCWPNYEMSPVWGCTGKQQQRATAEDGKTFSN